MSKFKLILFQDIFLMMQGTIYYKSVSVLCGEHGKIRGRSLYRVKTENVYSCVIFQGLK